MEVFDPFINIAIVLAAALVGGMIAHRLRQPVILGYLLVGVAIGPYGFGLVRDVELIEDLAVIGVALLMFAVGLEISYSQLRQVGNVGIWGGIAQIIATFILGTLVGKLLFQWPLDEAAFFGLLISLSSTMVCFKILIERGELDSIHGRLMIAILIVQDLSVVLMMVGVPVFGSSSDSLLSAFILAAVKAVLFLAIAVALGIWVLPWLLGRVAGVRSRELFLLTVLIMCLGAAFATQIFGLSIALGAFMVGLLLRESIFVHQALAEITPLRDVFATLFFVSLGMLLQPQFVINNWGMVALAVFTIIAVKFAVVFSITRFFGCNRRTGIIVGFGLFQIGEFSFVLLEAGNEAGIISQYFYSLMVVVTVVTMLLTPLLFNLANLVQPRKAYDELYNEAIHTLITLPADAAGPRRTSDVIVCGCGRVGRNIVKSLRELEISYLVIENDPEVVSELREQGHMCIYGEASNVPVLTLAGIENAKVMVVTYPGPLDTVREARGINPGLKIIARLAGNKESEILRQLGVVELISPEYEASFEFTRRTLACMGWGRSRIRETMDRLWPDEPI